MSTRTVLIRVTGRVQGVGFRAFVEQHAVERSLSGWVRNRRDGSVEALLSGESETVDALLAICRAGPRPGTAAAVEILDEPPPVSGPFLIAPSF